MTDSGKHMCPATGRIEPAVEVGGHVQCVQCGQNIDPCCGGAPCRASGPPQEWWDDETDPFGVGDDAELD